jgi:SAM-dependent methyltransferase
MIPEAPGSIPAPPPPRCPVTGLPAVRQIQAVSGNTLRFIWRVSHGVRVDRQMASIERFRLWESPCGLAFFDPMVAGDKEFYADFYGRLGEEGPWQEVRVERSDYARVAAEIKPGERVLDIGCGPAGFARWVPQARYIGLERSEEARRLRLDADVRHETVAEHAVGHRGEYDVVCSFHVIEHVAEPGAFAADMAHCLRPGGRLYIAAPGWPGAMTDIPNFALNAPPHHLSWWTESAFAALAERAGLVAECVEVLSPSPHLSLLYWMGRLAPKITGERYFRHAWGWYGALIWSWLAGRVCNALFGPPSAANPFELLLIARKPG